MRHRILLVEDDPANAHITQLICEKSGYVVHSATNGIQALEHLAIDQFDLVLLDIVMPGMDGVEVAQRIQSNRKTENIPIIFVTAIALPDQLAKLSVLQPAGIVTKPFSPKCLLAVVQDALEGSHGGHTVITSPAKSIENGLNDLARFGFFEDPGQVSCQEKKAIAGVAVGLGDSDYRIGRRQSRPTSADVNPLLEAHQAGLRDSNKLGSGSLGQLFGFSQPVDKVPEPLS